MYKLLYFSYILSVLVTWHGNKLAPYNTHDGSLYAIPKLVVIMQFYSRNDHSSWIFWLPYFF